MSATVYVVKDSDEICEELLKNCKSFYVKNYQPEEKELEMLENNINLFLNGRKSVQRVFERDDFTQSGIVGFLASEFEKKNLLILEEEMSGWNDLLIII